MRARAAAIAAIGALLVASEGVLAQGVSEPRPQDLAASRTRLQILLLADAVDQRCGRLSTVDRRNLDQGIGWDDQQLRGFGPRGEAEAEGMRIAAQREAAKLDCASPTARVALDEARALIAPAAAPR